MSEPKEQKPLKIRVSTADLSAESGTNVAGTPTVVVNVCYPYVGSTCGIYLTRRSARRLRDWFSKWLGD